MFPGDFVVDAHQAAFTTSVNDGQGTCTLAGRIGVFIVNLLNSASGGSASIGSIPICLRRVRRLPNSRRHSTCRVLKMAPHDQRLSSGPTSEVVRLYGR